MSRNPLTTGSLRESWEPVIRALATGALTLAAGYATGMVFSNQPPQWYSIVAAVLTAALSGWALYELRLGRFHRAVKLMVTVLLVVVSYGLFRQALIERTSTVSLYTLPIALSALLLGRAALVTTTGIATASILLLASFRHVPGLGPQFINPLSTGVGPVLLLSVLIVILLALFLDRFTVSLQMNLNSLRRQEQANFDLNMSLLQHIEQLGVAERERNEALDAERASHRLMEHANIRSSFLAEMGRFMNTPQDLESTLSTLPQLLTGQFGGRSAVYLLQADGTLQRATIAEADERVARVVRTALADPTVSASIGEMAMQSVRSGRPVVVDDAASTDGDHARAAVALGDLVLLLVPLINRGASLGVISLAVPRGTVQLDADMESFFVEIGRRGAAAITYAREFTETLDLNEELERRVAARTAELQAVNAELETFTYSASHDLRAPLRGIDGFSQALEEDYGDQLDETARGYLNRIRTGAQRMAGLIDDLLSLSRISQGTMVRADVDISSLATEILEDLQAAEPERQMEVEVQPGMTAHADARLVEIVLTNLLGNAWKFTSRKPGGRISVTSEKIGDEQVFHVRDNGAGFNMDYSSKLFAPFQRLHSVDEFHGSGIGLATTYRIIRRHGGRIWAEGEPDQGAMFSFVLEPATR